MFKDDFIELMGEWKYFFKKTLPESLTEQWRNGDYYVKRTKPEIKAYLSYENTT